MFKPGSDDDTAATVVDYERINKGYAKKRERRRVCVCVKVFVGEGGVAGV